MFCNKFTTLLVYLTAAAGICLAQRQPQPGAAQTQATENAGTFTGRLSGAGMDGATVTATNAATGATQSAVTDAEGHFTLANLPPGSYRLFVRLKSGLQLTEKTIEISSTGSDLQI